MKKVFFAFLLVFTIAFTANAFASEATFTAKSYTVSESEHINYWLFTPQNAPEKMPLIVYLHGGSGKGDNINTLTENGFCKWVAEGIFDSTAAYIVFPQLSSNYNGWAGNKTNIRNFIVNLTNKYSIDKENISLVGHSMGGTGAFSLATAYPSLFSCVMPMSGSATNNEKTLTALSALPVWAIVGENDTIVSPTSSIEIVNALQEKGADAKITVIEDATHFTVPELAFLDDELDVVGWLIRGGKDEEQQETEVTVADVLDCICSYLNRTNDLKYDANNDGLVNLLDAIILLKQVVKE